MLDAIFYKKLNSTQDTAKKLASDGRRNFAVVADSQMKARGRFGRKWHAGKGGLWASIAVAPSDMEHVQYLTFAAATSVANALKKCCNLDVKIKWPNDVHYNGLKICGILTEGAFGKESFAVVGIGLNVNQKKFSVDIKKTATSIKKITGKEHDIKKILDSVLKNFNRYCILYKSRNYSKILYDWKKYCDTIGKEVKAISSGKKISERKIISGKAVGIDEDLNLIIMSCNKKIALTEGDVSVRY